MPTIYTKGPARVEVTERGGGGCLPWVVLLAMILIGGAGAAEPYLAEAEHAAVDVLEIAGCAVGVVAAGVVLVMIVRAARTYRRNHPGRAVNVVTDAQWPQMAAGAWPTIEMRRPGLPIEADGAEPDALNPWADEQWRQDVRSQRWPGVPREWSEPVGSWPDEWNQWGQR